MDKNWQGAKRPIATFQRLAPRSLVSFDIFHARQSMMTGSEVFLNSHAPRYCEFESLF